MPEKSEKRISAEEKRYIRIQQGVEENLLSIAIMLSAIPATRKDGVVVAARLVATSDDIMGVARKDARFCSVLEKYLSYSVYASLFGGLAITASLIAANHGINVLSFLPGYKLPEKKEDEPEKEISEGMRAMMFASLVARQEKMKSDLDEGISA